MPRKHEKNRYTILVEWLVVGLVLAAILFFIGGPVLEVVLRTGVILSWLDLGKGSLFLGPVFIGCMMFAYLAHRNSWWWKKLSPTRSDNSSDAVDEVGD